MINCRDYCRKSMKKKITYSVFLFIYGFCMVLYGVSLSDRQIERNQKKQNVSSLGVYIYSRSLEKYNTSKNEMLELCKEIGITEVYMSFSNKSFELDKSNYTKMLQEYIQLFHNNSIKVFALAYGEPDMIIDAEKMNRTTDNIIKYSSSAKFKFDGVTADLEPHMLKKGSRWVGNTSIFWSKDGYGSTNIQLLKLSLERLSSIRKRLNQKLLFSEAVSWIYFKKFAPFIDRIDKNAISLLNCYLSSGCDFITIMAYRDSPERVIKSAEYCLNSAKRAESVVVCVKTSIGTQGGGGKATSFYNMNRIELREAVCKISKTLGKSSSFRGIAFFEFSGLAAIWNRR